MSKPPFFSSIDPDSFSETRREGNIKLIRNRILQSAESFRYKKWNLANLLNSINRSPNKFYSINCLSILLINNEVFVYLESGELLQLKTYISKLYQKGFKFNILFFYSSKDITVEVETVLKEFKNLNYLTCISVNDSRKFLFALSCELVNWWGLKSTLHESTSYFHISQSISNLISNYKNVCTEIDFNCTVIKNNFQDSIAWQGGDNYCPLTDIDKIINNARNEQVADTIKRIFDSAAHPREEHMHKTERLVSSQGLFWLSEISSINDIDDWITYTRFYSDIFAGVITSEFKTNLEPQKKVELLNFNWVIGDFIRIVSNRFAFGIELTDIQSEPPADYIQESLDDYYILKYPITEEIWCSIIEHSFQKGPCFPITNISYFDIQFFLNILNELSQPIIDMHYPGFIFNLPTEYQWEAAARGVQSYNYPWGNDFDIKKCNCEMSYGTLTEVGTFSPHGDSVYGCQDMSGNVREWTRSYGGTRGVDWSKHTNEIIQNGSDTVIQPYSRMIIKGGSYSYSAECVQAWVRNTQISSRRDNQTGFRLVLEKV